MEPNKYELGVIIRADLEEEVYRAELERVKGFVDRFGGTIEKIDDWGRRKLAYPIQKLTEGMYTFITYTSQGGNTPGEIEGRLRLQENVLRFLTVRLGDLEATEAPSVSTSNPTSVEVKEEVKEEVKADAPEPVVEPVTEEAETAEPVTESEPVTE